MEEKKQFLCGVVEGKTAADFITDLLSDHVIFFSYPAETILNRPPFDLHFSIDLSLTVEGGRGSGNMCMNTDV